MTRMLFSQAGQTLVRLTVAALLAIAVALVLFGGTAKAETIKLGNSILVTDNIPPELLPEVVKHMTAKQFEEFAKQRNADAYAQARTNHEAYLAARGPLRAASISEHSGTSNTRYGGGVGYNGMGGSGGYAGYNGLYTGFGSNTSYLSGGGGNNYGLTFVGNNMRTTTGSTDKSYGIEYPDLNDAGGGGVMLINPYCFNYWRRHTQDE